LEEKGEKRKAKEKRKHKKQTRKNIEEVRWRRGAGIPSAATGFGVAAQDPRPKKKNGSRLKQRVKNKE